MINTKLSTQEQEQILNHLFGFYFIDVDKGESTEPYYVLHDEDGCEFYGKDANDKFNFDTLSGVFEYLTFVSIQAGYNQKSEDVANKVATLIDDLLCK